MVRRAGLDGIDALLADLTPEPRSLTRSVTRAGTLLRAAVETARA